MLYCPISKHFKILPKSIGIVTNKQMKYIIYSLDFVYMKYHLLFRIVSTYPFIFPAAAGNIWLQNYASPQKKQRIRGAKNRKLVVPTHPIPIYKIFWPWLFNKAFCKYSLLNLGAFNILISPHAEAKNPTVTVQDILKIAININAAFNAVSAIQIEGIFLFCALFSISFPLQYLISNENIQFFINILTNNVLFTLYMNDLFGIKCIFCQNSPSQFSMLTCSHIVCGDCLASFYQSQAKMNKVPCPCGLITNIPNKRSQQFRQSQLLRPCSSMANLKRRKTQIFDQSLFVVNEINGRSTGKPSKLKDDNSHVIHRKQNLQNYLMTELVNEIKFMELRFKRYLNEINRSYNRLVIDLNKNYQQVSASIIDKCKQKICSSEIMCLYSIQNFIERSFKPDLEKKLAKISRCLNQFVVKQSSEKQNNKQNIGIRANQSQNRKNESCKKISTHESCKYEAESQFLSQLKSATAKNSKITRKKRINRFSSHKLIDV